MSDMDISVVFRGLDHSDAVDARIKDEAQKLERLFNRTLSGTATVESPHSPQGLAQAFSVHLRLLVQGIGELIVSHEVDNCSDVMRAVRDAFTAARRQIKDRIERLQGRSRQQEKTLADHGSA